MTIPSWAKPGVKCVCVDAKPNRLSDPVFLMKWLPLEGEVYTIKDVVLHPRSVAVTLEECSDDRLYCAIWRFRPVVSRSQEQDVALFTHLLDGLPIREGV